MNVRQWLCGLRSRGGLIAWVFLGALMFWPPLASAHHSFTNLRTADGKEVIEVIEGTVRVFRILNPHGAMIVDAVQDSGDAEGWLLEMSSAASLHREGWTDDLLGAGDAVTVSIFPSSAPNRARLRAVLIHPKAEEEAARLMVSYGIRGDTPIMRRLRERLPVCGTITSGARTECFVVDADALHALETEFPGPMGYVMP